MPRPINAWVFSIMIYISHSINGIWMEPFLVFHCIAEIRSTSSRIESASTALASLSRRCVQHSTPEWVLAQSHPFHENILLLNFRIQFANSDSVDALMNVLGRNTGVWEMRSCLLWRVVQRAMRVYCRQRTFWEGGEANDAALWAYCSKASFFSGLGKGTVALFVDSD